MILCHKRITLHRPVSATGTIHKVLRDESLPSKSHWMFRRMGFQSKKSIRSD